jgi:hypothetical protein
VFIGADEKCSDGGRVFFCVKHRFFSVLFTFYYHFSQLTSNFYHDTIEVMCKYRLLHGLEKGKRNGEFERIIFPEGYVRGDALAADCGVFRSHAAGQHSAAAV